MIFSDQLEPAEQSLADIGFPIHKPPLANLALTLLNDHAVNGDFIDTPERFERPVHRFCQGVALERLRVTKHELRIAVAPAFEQDARAAFIDKSLPIRAAIGRSLPGPCFLQQLLTL